MNTESSPYGRYRTSLITIMGVFLQACGGSNGGEVESPTIDPSYFMGGSICVEKKLVSEPDALNESAQTPAESLIDCDEPPNSELPIADMALSTTGQGAFAIGNASYSITGMVIGDIDSPPSDSHYGRIALLHDGEYRSAFRSDGNGTNRLDWGIYSASMVLTLEFFVREGVSLDSLDGQSIEFSVADVIDESSFIDSDVFVSSTLFVDDNEDKSIDLENDRILRVTSGTLDWSENEFVTELQGDIRFGDTDVASFMYSGLFEELRLPATPEVPSIGQSNR